MKTNIAQLLRKQVNIVTVLADYGYRVRRELIDYEQQFSCDLHGDGSDSKPSARVYPESQSWYCFACSQSRDAIRTAQEKEGKSFYEACQILARRYNITLPRYTSEEAASPVVESVADAYEEKAQASLQRCHLLLVMLGQEQKLLIDTYFRLCESLDVLQHFYESGRLSAQDIVIRAAKLRDSIIQQVQKSSF
jgi:DNA primase